MAVSSHAQQIEQYRPLVSKYFAPQDVDQAMMLMWYESRGRTDAADPRGQARRVEAGKSFDSIPPRHQSVPELLDRIADRRDGTETRDDNAAFHEDIWC